MSVKTKSCGVFGAGPLWLGPVSVVFVMLILLGACSRKEDTNAAKPVVFFAPATISNVPDICKPLYLGELLVDRVAAFRAGLPYESVSLERTTNSASSPIYRVTFHRSGQAELTTNALPPKIGKFTGQVDLPTFARICYVLDNSRFNDFQDKYRANPLENTACIVTVSTGKSQKTVTDYGAIGPIQLWTIEQLIDGVRERTDWKPVPKPK